MRQKIPNSESKITGFGSAVLVAIIYKVIEAKVIIKCKKHTRCKLITSYCICPEINRLVIIILTISKFYFIRLRHYLATKIDVVFVFSTESIGNAGAQAAKKISIPCLLY